MEFLNRTLSPFGDSVWNTIESELSGALAKRLTLRGVVDFDETPSFDTDALSTGTLKKISSKAGLNISSREPIKMVEIQQTFSVSKDIIEDIKRAKVDFDNTPFNNVANTFSKVENDMILNGLKEANISGMLSKETPSLNASTPKDILVAVAKSMGIFNANFINGPYVLVISSATMAKLMVESFDSKSLKSKIEEILGKGSIIINNDIGDDKAIVVSQRGGDFTFYSGLDVSLGYENETKDAVELFLIQSCAFRTITPESVVLINIK